MTISLRFLAPAAFALGLTGCGESGPVNPPTQPAAPVEAVDPTAPPPRGQTSMLPGRGATSFVGRWAADVSWCAAPQGERRPIEITSTRFEGYENSCEIAAVDEVADGYVATLACVSEGTVRSERVRFQVTQDVMRLSYLDRAGDPVTLRKCTTLEDTATTPAVVP
jgi:predicted small lipoprotein YifL